MKKIEVEETEEIEIYLHPTYGNPYYIHKSATDMVSEELRKTLVIDIRHLYGTYTEML